MSDKASETKVFDVRFTLVVDGVKTQFTVCQEATSFVEVTESFENKLQQLLKLGIFDEASLNSIEI